MTRRYSLHARSFLSVDILFVLRLILRYNVTDIVTFYKMLMLVINRREYLDNTYSSRGVWYPSVATVCPGVSETFTKNNWR